MVENDRTLATYGINAVCTHLGCVVPWNKAENKFLCPCHGSQYNNQGRVVRGPAPLVIITSTHNIRNRHFSTHASNGTTNNLRCGLLQSLALAHADIDDGKVVFVPWTETDFRTGETPWWS